MAPSSSLFLSSSRFTSSSSIPLSLKCSIQSRTQQQQQQQQQQHPVVLKVTNTSLLGFSGQSVFLKKKNLEFFSMGLSCRCSEGGDSSSSSSETASSEAAATSENTSSPKVCEMEDLGLFLLLGKIWKGYALSNRLDFEQKLKSIYIDLEGIDSVEFLDKPVSMSEGEARYCDYVIGIVSRVKSWVVMGKVSLIQLISLLVLPRLVFLTVNSIIKALFRVENGIGNVLDVLKNVGLNWGIKSKWGKKFWPKPPKRVKVERVVKEAFEEEKDNDDDDDEEDDVKKDRDVMMSSDDEDEDLKVVL